MTLRERARATGLDDATYWLLAIAFVLAAMHITDHVLRVDHSGWPFRPQVTPFTFSFLAFPMLLFALFGPHRLYWWRWALLLIATIATVFAHVAVETPHMQFAMWAYDRSSDLQQQGFHNIPHLKAPALGVSAMIVAMALNVTASPQPSRCSPKGCGTGLARPGKQVSGIRLTSCDRPDPYPVIQIALRLL